MPDPTKCEPCKLAAAEALAGEISDSDGRVGRDGGTATGGRDRRSGKEICDVLETGVGDGS